MANKKSKRFPSIEELRTLNQQHEEVKYAEFNRLKEPFIQSALALLIAERLLQNPNLIADQKKEVVRERNFARISLYRTLEEILEVGYPDHYISGHLQIDTEQKKKT